MEQIEVKLANDTNGIGRAGERVTLTVTPADMRSTEELETYLAGYKNFNYRADEVSPQILVDNQTDKYRTFDSDDAFLPRAQKGSLSGPIPEADPKSAPATYKTEARVIGSFVPDELPTNFDPKYVALQLCKNAIALDREIEVMAAVGTSTNWDSTVRTALASGYQWNGGTSSNPIEAIQDAIEKSAQPVNSIWMNQHVGNLFIRHAEVRNHMRQFLGDGAAAQAATSLANVDKQPVDFVIPGLPPIRISNAKKRTTSGGALSYILGNVAVLVTRPMGVPQSGQEVASTYSFTYKGPSGTGYEVREWRVEGRGAYGGEMIAVTQSDDVVMTSTIAGGIITGIVQ